MSWHFSQALEAASSEENSAGGERYALSNSTTTAVECSCADKMTACSNHSRSGTTCEPSMATRGVEWWTSSLAASRAKTSAPPEKVPESTGRKADCGKRWRESLAKWDRATSSWKTPHSLFSGDLAEFSGTWPRWGMMRDGECWEQTPPAIRITEPEFGWLPTPSGVNGGNNNTMGRIDEWGGSSNPLRGTVIGYLCLPEFEEMVMGWPIGWTAPTPYATAKFRRWFDSLGTSSTMNQKP